MGLAGHMVDCVIQQFAPLHPGLHHPFVGLGIAFIRKTDHIVPI